jgi:glycosyltransferase involved in cell wall biosynthesis
VRLLWVGTWEADYPRYLVLRAGLAALGHEVVACHEPVWERTTHKAGAYLAPGRLAVTAGRFTAAWARVLRAERRVGPVDAVVAGYPAQPDAWPAWLVARRRGVPLVADMMISFSDTLAGDRGRARGPATRLLTALDAGLVRAADLLVADTRAGGDWIERRFPRARGRVAVVPVGADPAAFPAAPREPPGPVRVLFVGKLAPLHGLGVVLAAARMPGVPPVRIIGSGQLGPWLQDELARDRPPGLEHVPWVPYDDLGAEIAAAHICLGVFGGSDKAARVVPNKVWQAMAVGRPVVTADTPGVREVLTDGRDALLVPAGDPRALAAALARLAADPGLRARLGAAARRRYEELGAPSPVAARLADAIRAITASARASAEAGPHATNSEGSTSSSSSTTGRPSEPGTRSTRA